MSFKKLTQEDYELSFEIKRIKSKMHDVLQIPQSTEKESPPMEAYLPNSRLPYRSSASEKVRMISHIHVEGHSAGSEPTLSRIRLAYLAGADIMPDHAVRWSELDCNLTEHKSLMSFKSLIHKYITCVCTY